MNVPLLPKSFTVDGETTPMVYRSFSADMNLDDSYNLFTGNPTLSYDETFGLPGQGLKPNFLWTSILQTAYRITGYVIETRVETETVVRNGVPIQYKVIKEKLSKEFRNNDIAVTREAASVGPFVEIHHLKANHSTIARPDTAVKVIEELRRIQPMPPAGFIPE
jgi:hypothetical protein